MKKVMVTIKVDDRQETRSLPLLERNGEFFVANPYHPGISHQPAEVRLDPTRLKNVPEMPETLNYTGLLLQIRTIQEA